MAAKILRMAAKFLRMFVICIDIHLAVATIELKTEAAAVAKAQVERLTPRRTLPAVTDTIAERVTQTVAALHKHGIGRWTELVGRKFFGAVETGGGAVGDVVKMGLRVRRT